MRCSQSVASIGGDEPKAAEKQRKKSTGSSTEPIVRKHEIVLEGKPLKYTATTGMMPIQNAEGETEGNIFFIAYTLDDAVDKAKRPLMFSFNAVPGVPPGPLPLRPPAPHTLHLPPTLPPP